jgi:valyl-tRNA synthetase
VYPFWEANQLFEPHTAQAAFVQAGGTVPQGNPHFSVVLPPPNVTGVLHMGHALDCTIQDIFVRYHRMLGYRTAWIPGCDHAGIATQTVVEKRLKAGQCSPHKAGSTRQSLGKTAFLGEVWTWAEHCQREIMGQFRRLGISPDWSRQRFTLDEGLSDAVQTTFVRLYEEGLIYQGWRIVNWDPATQSAISDIETEYTEEASHLWHIAYKVVGTEEQLVVATTRPETLFGDVAVAVHPQDERYAHLIGQQVALPLCTTANGEPRTIPVIGDKYVEKDFGTGCLKITPAHDPNDYAVGQRHGLEPLLIFNEKAELLPHPWIPQALHGLERWAARSTTEALLQEAGLLVAKQEHTHRVGRAQRSGQIVEPLLSKQWFVKAKPLAAKALAAYHAGELSFVPERWAKDYLRWLEHIEDWCISRQLWWGHAIPAWHHTPTGALHVGSGLPAGANPGEWEPDPDVLDTWFSSGLWPFSTLGWPQAGATDYTDFYPTSLLVTGFDIIFFWLARMTMLGQHLTGQSPFAKAYIHGLIRDDKGQKMSKSKGNTVDPVELIDSLGCDGFRFGLTSLITYGGQDIKLAKDKLETGKLFCNKLWNATRFVLLNLEGQPLATEVNPELLDAMDTWILGRYHHAVQEANRLLQSSRLGEYAQLMLDFVWYELCDWYVEYAKAAFKSEHAAKATNTRTLLALVLEGTLKLLHPIMPFITEALWQRLPNRQGLSISVAPFPTGLPNALVQATAATEALNTQVAFLLNTIKAMRHLRQQYQVPPSKPLAFYLASPVAAELETLKHFESVLHHFVALEALHFEAWQGAPSEAALEVVSQTQVVLPLAGLIDPEAERQRLSKKQAELEKELEKVRHMLGNEGFVQRAPAAVVAKHQAQQAELEAQLAALIAQMQP